MLLVVGLVMIKQGRVIGAQAGDAHGVCACRCVFLVCYLWYHYQVGSVKFTHPGAIRYVYYVILLTHVRAGGDGAGAGNLDRFTSGCGRRAACGGGDSADDRRRIWPFTAAAIAAWPAGRTRFGCTSR